MLAAVTTALCLLGVVYAHTACYSSPSPEDWPEEQVRNTTIKFDNKDVPSLKVAKKALKKVAKELQDLAKKGLEQAINFMEEIFPPPPSKENKKKKKKKRKKAAKKKQRQKQSKKQELQSSCPGPDNQCTSISIPLRCVEHEESLCFVLYPFGRKGIYYPNCSCVSCVQQDFNSTGHCMVTDFAYVQIVAYCLRLSQPFVKLLVLVPLQCRCVASCTKDADGPTSQMAPVPEQEAFNATQEALSLRGV